MTDMGWVALLVLAMPTSVMSSMWFAGHRRYGRPAPVRVRQNDVVIIRKR